jgi:hypothetical protein
MDKSLQEMANEAKTRYDNAQRAIRDGDWAGYGEEMKRLGEILVKISAE